MTRDPVPSGMNRRRLLHVVATATLAVGLQPARPANAAEAPDPGSPIGPLPESWHQAEYLALWPDGTPGGGFAPTAVPADFPPGFFRNVAEPFVKVFRPDRPNGRAVLLMPGGAYSFVVGTHEGAGTAEALNALGYVVYVLIYRLPGEGWTSAWNVPLQDAQRAMRLIRSRAGHDGISPDRIVALGYSAGGHLAASLATAFETVARAPADPLDRLDARPSAVGLIYPVITLSPPLTNPQTALSLLGVDPPADRVALRSPALHVSAQTPATFLVHALDDTAVPPENTLMMLEALRQAGVPAEAHLLQEGGHGFGLGMPGTPAHQWPILFDLWLDRRFAGTG